MRLWTPIIRAKFPSIHYTSPFKGDDIEGRLFQVNENNVLEDCIFLIFLLTKFHLSLVDTIYHRIDINGQR